MTNHEYKDKILIIQSKESFYFRKTIAYIDDEKMIVDNSKYLIERIIAGIFALGIGIFSIWSFLQLVQDWSIYILFIDLLIGLPILGCTILLVNVILNTERKFIFNRMDGTLTMRASVLNWIPRTITIPFEEARIGISGTPIAKSLNVQLPTSRLRHLRIISIQDSTDWTNCMSFIVWYMDRNRPLPPGEDLNAYRQKDYERRKAEGFPKPLYKSTIPMTDVDGDTQRYKSCYLEEKDDKSGI